MIPSFDTLLMEVCHFYYVVCWCHQTTSFNPSHFTAKNAFTFFLFMAANPSALPYWDYPALSRYSRLPWVVLSSDKIPFSAPISGSHTLFRNK